MDSRALAAIVGSVITGLITVWLVAWIAVQTEVSVFGLNVLFIIPVGAILCGLLVAAGYFGVSRLLHYRPSTAMVVVPAVIGIAGYFLTHYFIYRMLKADAGGLLLSFRGYFEVSLESSSLSVGRSGSSTGELGGLGYVLGLLQLVGFTAGGVAVHILLRRLPWCEPSERYFTRGKKQNTWYDDTVDPVQVRAQLGEALNSGNPAALDAAMVNPNKVAARKRRSQALRTEHKCSDCGVGTTTIEVKQRNGNNWVHVGPAMSIASEPTSRPNPRSGGSARI